MAKIEEKMQSKEEKNESAIYLGKRKHSLDDCLSAKEVLQSNKVIVTAVKEENKEYDETTNNGTENGKEENVGNSNLNGKLRFYLDGRFVLELRHTSDELTHAGKWIPSEEKYKGDNQLHNSAGNKIDVPTNSSGIILGSFADNQASMTKYSDNKEKLCGGELRPTQNREDRFPSNRPMLNYVKKAARNPLLNVSLHLAGSPKPWESLRKKPSTGKKWKLKNTCSLAKLLERKLNGAVTTNLEDIPSKSDKKEITEEPCINGENSNQPLGNTILPLPEWYLDPSKAQVPFDEMIGYPRPFFPSLTTNKIYHTAARSADPLATKSSSSSCDSLFMNEKELNHKLDVKARSHVIVDISYRIKDSSSNCVPAHVFSEVARNYNLNVSTVTQWWMQHCADHQITTSKKCTPDSCKSHNEILNDTASIDKPLDLRIIKDDPQASLSTEQNRSQSNSICKTENCETSHALSAPTHSKCQCFDKTFCKPPWCKCELKTQNVEKRNGIVCRPQHPAKHERGLLCTNMNSPVIPGPHNFSVDRSAASPHTAFESWPSCVPCSFIPCGPHIVSRCFYYCCCFLRGCHCHSGCFLNPETLRNSMLASTHRSCNQGHFIGSHYMPCDEHLHLPSSASNTDVNCLGCSNSKLKELLLKQSSVRTHASESK